MGTKTRCLLSATLAVFGFLLFIYRLVPYSEREKAQTASGFVILTVLAFLAGFAFGVGARRRHLVAFCFMGALFAANAVLIALDVAADRTSHSLFPFEFIGLGIVASPAFVGASASRVIDRIRSARQG